jgi:hypothetical protein
MTNDVATKTNLGSCLNAAVICRNQIELRIGGSSSAVCRSPADANDGERGRANCFDQATYGKFSPEVASRERLIHQNDRRVASVVTLVEISAADQPNTDGLQVSITDGQRPRLASERAPRVLVHADDAEVQARFSVLQRRLMRIGRRKSASRQRFGEALVERVTGGARRRGDDLKGQSIARRKAQIDMRQLDEAPY